MFPHGNGYWEVYRRFQTIFWLGGGVGKEGVMWGKLSMKEFVMGEENFYEGGAAFSSII